MIIKCSLYLKNRQLELVAQCDRRPLRILGFLISSIVVLFG